MLKRAILIIKTIYFLDHFPNVLTLIFSNKKKIIYYGYLGDGNFGDEMVFSATKILFKDCLIIPYKRHMPILIKLYCNLFTNSIDGIIIGGGTLIRKFNSDKAYFMHLLAKGKPVFLHGTGADEKLMDKSFWPHFLKSNFYGGVRGPQSQVDIENIGISYKQIGDAALYLKGVTDEVTKSKVIIVNFGTHKYLKDLKYSRNEIIKFLNNDLFKDYIIKFLPMHSVDYSLAKSLQLEINNLEVLKIASDYNETIKLMNEAEFCIGERLHFVVLSVLANTNFVSINYDTKHMDFLKSLSLEKFGYQPKKIDFNVLEKAFKKELGVVNWLEINLKLQEMRITNDSERDNFLASMKNFNS